MAFCGQDYCTVDANGRVKLSPRLLMDFGQLGESVVVHCLPEGALGVYPLSVWRQMRERETESEPAAARSIVARRQLRRFGALSQVDSISRQGRITIPVSFREIVGLSAGTEAVLVGVEIGIEVWSAERWNAEFQTLLQHEQDKAEREMQADLDRIDAPSLGAAAADNRNEN
ncbi:MAG: division/cell wall cluster transcriptional repressor MraZ [Verrucomicrobiota bacterium]